MSDDEPQSLWTGPQEDPNRYRIGLVDGMLVDVGGGGEGLVYEATTSADDVRVALKLHTSVAVDTYPDVAAAAHLLASVHHPNLMRQLDTFRGRALGSADPPPDEDFAIIYSTAAWIDGRPLDETVEHRGVAAGLRCVAEVARAVAALHATRGPEAPDGIVHGDVKPSNVRVTLDDHAVLIDFGVSRATTFEHPMNVGTFGWRAPEVAAGTGAGASPASDVWGVGALAYWVIVGEGPGRTDLAQLRAHVTDIGREKGFLNAEELASHVAAPLDPQPERRPRHLDRWADDLERLVRHRKRRAWSRRPSFIATIAAIAGLVVGIGLTVAIQSFDHWASTSSAAVGAPGSALRLARPFAVPDSRPDDEVLRQDHVVHYEGGRVTLGGQRDGTGALLVNDEIELQVTHPDGATASYLHNFAQGSDCRQDDVTPPHDVSDLFAPGRNTVRVIVRGGCNGANVGLGGFAGAGTPVWLVFGSD